MAISIVNGYFCASSCDVAKAKKGENPHPSTDPDNLGVDKNGKPDKPAVVFGGALSDLNATRADAVLPVSDTALADAAPLWTRKPAVDVLA